MNNFKIAIGITGIIILMIALVLGSAFDANSPQNRMYETLVEPVAEVGGTAIDGRNILDGIIGSFKFDGI